MSLQKYPYILFDSPPIGPTAFEVLESLHYPPIARVTDPHLSLEEQIEIVEAHKPTFLLVVGYGAILKQPLLDTVAGQVLNIHPSLLPLYRGPAPVVQALLDGATETGVSVMEIDKKMDHGPVLIQERYPLAGNETPAELYKILTTKGVHLLLEVLDDYLEDRLDLLPQEHDEATFSHFIKKEDGLLDLSKPAEELERMVRAFQGWPRTWVLHEGKRLIVDKAHLEDNRLTFDQVQPENGKLMSLKEYCAGRRITPEQFYLSLSGQS